MSQLSGMSGVRKRLLEKGIDMPLGSNVAVTAFPDVVRQVNSMPCRSFSPTRITGAACARCSIYRISHKCWVWACLMHSIFDLGVSLMAMSHVAADAPI